MKAQSPYRDDIVEIHTHGNPIIVETMSKELLVLNVRQESW